MNLFDQYIDETYGSLLSLPDPTGYAGASFPTETSIGQLSDGLGVLSPLATSKVAVWARPGSVAAKAYVAANPTTTIFGIQTWSGAAYVSAHEWRNNGQQVVNVNTTLIYSATVARTITFPDATGTVALTSNLVGYLQNNVGIAGGTTLVGGTGAGENITASTTSNGTKGKFIIGTSAYDEATNRWGVGNAAPTVPLDVTGAILGSSSITGASFVINAIGVITTGGADGRILMTNAAGTDFGLLQFGGTSAAFPALKRVSDTLQVRQANDAGFAAIRAFEVTVEADRRFMFASRGSLSADDDGLFVMNNAAGTSFNRLNFGGTTSAFPALRRNSTTLEVKLADNSAYTGLHADSLQTETPNSGTGNSPFKVGIIVAAVSTLDAGHYLEFESGGAAYKIALIT